MASQDCVNLYCDESGGTNEGLFVVAVVQIEPRAAKRAIKSFRRTTQWRDEVEGHRLSPDESRLFLDLVSHEDVSASAVVCDTRTACGAWASKTYTEARLRTEMVVEACSTLLQASATPPHRAITVDGGRYAEQVLNKSGGTSSPPCASARSS